eukprot:Gb_08594 [translate_table: standard]
MREEGILESEMRVEEFSYDVVCCAPGIELLHCRFYCTDINFSQFLAQDGGNSFSDFKQKGVAGYLVRMCRKALMSHFGCESNWIVDFKELARLLHDIRWVCLLRIVTDTMDVIAHQGVLTFVLCQKIVFAIPISLYCGAC